MARFQWKEVQRLSSRSKESLDQQLSSLENRLEQIQAQVKDLLRENHKLKTDLKFFELMLLEEYHLLIQLLNRDQNKIYIQSAHGQTKRDKNSE
jgi:regulator of replication initiation timing